MSYLTSAVMTLDETWHASEADYINQVCFSPDGNQIAVACADGSVAVYAQGGESLWRHCVHGLGATALAWAPDSTALASGGQDGIINIWQAQSGNRTHRYAGGRGWVEKLDWSQDGLLAAITGKQLNIWNDAGHSVSFFAAAGSTLTGLQWQADGSLLTSGYGQVLRWHPDHAAPVKEYAWKGSLLSLASSPNGHVIAAGSQEGAIHFWRTRKNNEFQMDGYNNKVRLIGWSPDSRFFFTAGSEALITWDCKGKGPEGTAPDYQDFHKAPITVLATPPLCTYVASGAEDGSLYIYDPKRRLVVATGAINHSVSAVAWHQGGEALMVGSSGGQITHFHVA